MSQIDNRANVGGIAEEMRHNDRPGFFRQHGLDRPGRDVELFPAVGKHRSGSNRVNRADNACTAKSWNHYFIALPNAALTQGDFQSEAA